jgi:hypothetical protein
LSRGAVTRLRRVGLGFVGALVGSGLAALVFWRLFPWFLAGALPGRLAVVLTPFVAGLGLVLPHAAWGFSVGGVDGARRSTLGALLAAAGLIAVLEIMQLLSATASASQLLALYLVGGGAAGSAWGFVWGRFAGGGRFGVRCGFTGLIVGLAWALPAGFILFAEAGTRFGFGVPIAGAVLPPAIIGLTLAGALLPPDFSFTARRTPSPAQ